MHEEKMKTLRISCMNNQRFLDSVADCQGGSDAFPRIVDPRTAPKTPYRHFEKLKSTLHQCVRDWAEEGAEERKATYGPLLEHLKAAMPVTGAVR